ncbi:hypothetical protein EDB81DRAFT_300169 [Dactylonectria macrodidyma]|uniref:BZIP domain-containing protein n=1 Tax=Dactylonectria macrodidyma TaxID=307937 RepID=A0A9P9D7H5_9HYPO|nr:hypothetical protein EDB81DRAFT_300169 [Dactylonectria macrodidyma]
MGNSQPARRGRPPIQDGQDVVNSQQKKRLRMRLAQRSYRSRKQEAQESERIRAEELSSALDNALATFSTLHRRILDTSQIRNSSDVLFHLNDAVTQMAAIASGTNKVLPLPHALEDSGTSSRQQTPGVLAPHQSVTVDSGATTISLRTSTSNQIPVSARVVRACFERVVSILSNSTVYGSQSPALALPLQLLGEEVLMDNSLRSLSPFHPSVADFQYPLHSAPRLPHMYRVVEGETKAVFRAPAPLVQRIVRGKTRTMLDTNFAPLQDEWLEAVDVEEYLEERGIYLCNTVSNGTTSTDDTMYQPSVPDSEQSISILTLPGAVTGGEMAWAINDNTPPRLDSMEQRPSVSLSADFHGHEPADYSVFGLPRPRRWLRSANSQLHSTAMAGVLQSDFNHQTAQGIAKASRVSCKAAFTIKSINSRRG